MRIRVPNRIAPLADFLLPRGNPAEEGSSTEYAKEAAEYVDNVRTACAEPWSEDAKSNPTEASNMANETPKFLSAALSPLIDLIESQVALAKTPDTVPADKITALDRMCVAAEAVRLFLAQHRHEESSALISSLGGSSATAVSFEYSASQPSGSEP